MRIAICDDDKMYVDEIASYIPDNAEYVIDKYYNPTVLFKSNIFYDVAFLDIEMDVIDGLKLADKIYEVNKECVITLFTAFSQYAIDGYKHHVFDYILKKDNKAVRAFSIKKSIDEAQNRINKECDNFIYIKTVNKKICINISQISYIEANNNNVIVHTRNKKMTCAYKMYEIEKMLEKRGFWRCHRSYIVNRQNVKEITGKFVHLTNGSNIPIGRFYRGR